MASVNVKRVTLSQTAIFSSKKTDLLVSQVVDRFKRDPQTRQVTEEPDGFNLTVLSPSTGEPQTVKLPLELKEEVEKVRAALLADNVVRVSFNGTMRGKFWAMVSDGRLNQGISATATDMTVVSIEVPDEDYLDLE